MGWVLRVVGGDKSLKDSLHNDDSISATLLAEFDLSDLDRYFRYYDGDLLRSPGLMPSITATGCRTNPVVNEV